ncbi:MAG: hypothetical protein ACFB9N_08535 [Geitlerinemataceae cyanobacterium]
MTRPNSPKNDRSPDSKKGGIPREIEVDSLTLAAVVTALLVVPLLLSGFFFQ